MPPLIALDRRAALLPAVYGKASRLLQRARLLTRWRTPHTLVALTVLALVLRLWRLDFQSLWLDEAHAEFYARQQTWQSTLEHLRKPGENGPIYFFLLHHWLDWFGTSPSALRGFSVLTGVVSVPLAWWAFCPLVPAPLPILIAGALAVAPYQVWYSQEAKMYALVLALTLVVLGAYARAIRRGRSPAWWIVAFVTLWAAVWTHFFAVLAAAGLGLYALVLPTTRIRRWVGIVLPALTVAVFVALELTALRQTRGLDAGAYGPTTIVATLLYAPVLNVAPVPVALAIGALTFILLTGVALPWPSGIAAHHRDRAVACKQPELRHRSRRSRWRRLWVSLRLTTRRLRAPGPLLAVSWALPVALYLLIHVWVSLFADRYFIWITPALYGLLATGVIALGRRQRPLGVAAAVTLLAAAGYGLVYAYTQPVKTDFRSLAATYDAGFQPGDGLVIVPRSLVFPFRYYARQPVQPVPLPVLAAGQDEPDPAAEVHKALTTHLRGRQRVWLVLGEAEPDRSRYARLVRAELARLGEREWESHYAGGIALERYRRSADAR